MKNYKTSKLQIYNNNGYQYIYIHYKEDGHTLKINTKLLYEKNKMTKDNLYNKKKENYQKLNTYIQETQYAVDTYINLVSGHKPVNQHELFTEPVIIKRKYIAEDDKLDELLKNDVITCHSCRRSMITNSFNDSYSIAQVMQMSGHKNLRTLKLYQDISNDELLNKNLLQKLNQSKKNID